MTTVTLTWHPRQYWPLPLINMMEKLEDLACVRQILRNKPCRMEVTCKSRRGVKRMMHVISHEAKVLNVQVHVPERKRKHDY